jgi:hypothetical protein
VKCPLCGMDLSMMHHRGVDLLPRRQDRNRRQPAARLWFRRSAIGATSVKRTAAFVIFIGDRFFGTVVAYVPGAQAAPSTFTSALPIQVFRLLVPKPRPLLDRKRRSAKPAKGAAFPVATLTSARADSTSETNPRDQRTVSFTALSWCLTPRESVPGAGR